MATAIINSTSDSKGETHENDSQNQPESPLQNLSPAHANYFEIAARATQDAFRDWNVTTGALGWPHGLLELLGFSPTAENQKVAFWWQRIHPNDFSRVQASLRETFAGTADRWSGEYRLLAADGDYRHILDRALLFRDDNGTVVRMAGPLMDVTMRKELQAQDCRSQRMEAFGQLAGGVAHDFNNFLTTILGYSDLLLTETGVKGQLASQIKEIRAAAGRASDLTNQLLAFSRRQSLEPIVVEVNTLINNLDRSLLRLLGDNISTVCHLHHLPQGAHIKVDAGQLTQIILNLAVNARDAMPKGGRLTIETGVLEVTEKTLPPVLGTDLAPGEYVSISLADNGCGMSDKVKARLFEPFFTTKREAHSSGLGLATSYGIIRQSGGHIYAESEEGRGTIFHLLLPRVVPPPVGYRKPDQRKLLTGTETVLVLEDEVGVRHLSVRVLRKLGYDVVEAARGDDAKRLIVERGPKQIDLVLTDMVMPEMSGRLFADWLQGESPRTKVIFISGYLEESLHPHDRREPGMNFLAKPFTANELASKVRAVLDGETAG
ncbi:MAG: ATP-binding protein [Chthoniobacterales bacterium]